jgi:hypothetical protein
MQGLLKKFLSNDKFAGKARALLYGPLLYHIHDLRA